MRKSLKQSEPVVQFTNGKVSTKIPRFELIPRDALVALARRFERGVRIKGDGAWNALTDASAADDTQFVIDRLAHCIDHCYKAIGRLTCSEELLSMEEINDGGDAGAIMFAGALLASHTSRDAEFNEVTK